MKFFAIQLNYAGLEVPRLQKWEENVKFQKMFDTTGFFKNEKVIMKIKSGNIFCPDILTEPVFMVSNVVKKILEKFEPNLLWREIVFNGSNVNMNKSLYFAPKLFEITAEKEYLAEKNRLNEKKQLMVKQDSIRDKAIFRLRENTQSYVVMRLDLIEILLRREVLQDGLVEVAFVEECKIEEWR